MDDILKSSKVVNSMKLDQGYRRPYGSYGNRYSTNNRGQFNGAGGRGNFYGRRFQRSKN